MEASGIENLPLLWPLHSPITGHKRAAEAKTSAGGGASKSPWKCQNVFSDQISLRYHVEI